MLIKTEAPPIVSRKEGFNLRPHGLGIGSEKAGGLVSPPATLREGSVPSHGVPAPVSNATSSVSAASALS